MSSSPAPSPSRPLRAAVPDAPGGVTLELKGWRAYGVQDGHLRGASLQFERDAPTLTGRAAASLAPDPIAPYFSLSRTSNSACSGGSHSS